MATTVKRSVDGHDFWFSIERPYDPDPETGELQEAAGYYVTFSVQKPSLMLQGEVIKDDRGAGPDCFHPLTRHWRRASRR